MLRLAAIFIGLATAAQSECAPREQVTAALSQSQHQEAQSGAGLAKDNQSVFEVWTGPEGSWTILRTMPSGVSCIMAYGFGWREFARQAPGIDG